MTEAFDRLKAALADRYTIERELGSGGMATVYLAHDQKHDRKVAIKVMRPELSAILGGERFLREVSIAAKLNHPHILALYDSGEAEEFLFYVMPHVDGESLRAKLNREKQLSVYEAISITKQVGAALDYAHEQGVIHRDIKPENILLYQGEALVADFGIALAVSAAGGTRLTDTGLSLGTPEYMSPEQATGDRELDARSDMYSLGAITYEMLVGEPPHTGNTVQAIIAKVVSVEPQPVSRIRHSVPSNVDAAVMCALAKTPADRYTTAAQFVEALNAPVKRRLILQGRGMRGALVGVGVVVVAAALALAISLTRTTEIGPPRIVVLPIENLGAPEDEYFADGLTEELINRLAQIAGLTVISRTSAMQYKGEGRPPLPQIGRELDVAYAVEGTIRTDRAPSAAGQVRVTAQLIRVEDDIHLWSDGYTVELTPGEVLGVQADVAEQVANALDITLLEPERRALESRPTDIPEAFDYYLRGRDYAGRGFTEEALRIAVQMYQRAIELDPKFALAYAQLSQVHALLYWFYYDRSEQRLAMAKAAADSALSIGPDLAESHLALGYYHYWGMRDYDRALEQFAIAERGRPTDAELLTAIGLVQARQGNPEGLRRIEMASELDPRSVNILGNLGLMYSQTRRYPEAENTFDRAISLAPDLPNAQMGKAMLSLAWQGVGEGAREALRISSENAAVAELFYWLASWFDQRAFFRIDDEYQQMLDRLSMADFQRDSVAYLLAKAVSHGQRREPRIARAYYDSARVVLEAHVRARPEDARSHGRLGLAYAALGRDQEAISEGEMAVELFPVARDALVGTLHVQHLAEILTMVGQYDAAMDQIEYLLSIPSYMSVPLLRADPLYDPLRNDSRFQALLEKYGN